MIKIINKCSNSNVERTSRKVSTLVLAPASACINKDGS